MHVYKRPNSPFWWYRFVYNGKKYSKTTKVRIHPKSKDLALSVANEEYLKVVKRHKLGAKPEITLGDSCQMVIDSVSGKTKTSYELSYRKLVGQGEFHKIWHLSPDLLWTDLTQEHVDDHLVARKKEGLAGNSILIEVRFLQRVYNVVRRKYETNNLVFNKPAVKSKIRYLSERELSTIAQRLQEHNGPSYVKAYDLFLFLLKTGVRLGEALDLQWEDIDWSNHRIEVYRPKVKVTSYVPMADVVSTRLEGKQEPQPFGSMSRAVRLLRKTIDEVCNTERNTLRYGRATVHSLRDTFATDMLDRGMDCKKLSNLLGHSSVRMTEKYVHVKSDRVAEEARLILNS